MAKVTPPVARTAAPNKNRLAPGNPVAANSAAGLTVNENDAVALCPGLLESVAVTEKLHEPGVVGVPLNVPVNESRTNPGGSEPAVTTKCSGLIPPLVNTDAP